LKGNIGRNRWNAEKVCRDIVLKTTRGRTLEAAERYLKTVSPRKPSGSTAAPPPKPVPHPKASREPQQEHGNIPPVTYSPPPAVDLAGSEIGLEGAVNRLRHYEHLLAARLSNEMQADGNIAGAYRDWIMAVEQMRKIAGDMLDVLARRKVLIPVDQAKALPLRMVETTKGLLLVMPAKLSGELEGMKWQDIKQRLDQEIADILTNLSSPDSF